MKLQQFCNFSVYLQFLILSVVVYKNVTSLYDQNIDQHFWGIVDLWPKHSNFNENLHNTCLLMQCHFIICAKHITWDIFIKTFSRRFRYAYRTINCVWVALLVVCSLVMNVHLLFFEYQRVRRLKIEFSFSFCE